VPCTKQALELSQFESTGRPVIFCGIENRTMVNQTLNEVRNIQIFRLHSNAVGTAVVLYFDWPHFDSWL
jgi:hypothetical protein